MTSPRQRFPRVSAPNRSADSAGEHIWLVSLVLAAALLAACGSDRADPGDDRQNLACERKDSEFTVDVIELATNPMSPQEALEFAAAQEQLPRDGYSERAESDGMTKTFFIEEDRKAIVTVQLRFYPSADSWFPERVVACIDALESNDLE